VRGWASQGWSGGFGGAREGDERGYLLKDDRGLMIGVSGWVGGTHRYSPLPQGGWVTEGGRVIRCTNTHIKRGRCVP